MLDVIRDNMAFLVQLGKYAAINVADSTTMWYYVIKYLYKPYTQQENLTTDGQEIKAGENLLKAE